MKHEQTNCFLKFSFSLYFSLKYSLNNFLESCECKAIYRKLCLWRTKIFDTKRKGNTGEDKSSWVCTSSYRSFEEPGLLCSVDHGPACLRDPRIRVSSRTCMRLIFHMLLQKRLSADDLPSLSLAVMLFCLSFVHG